MAGVYPGFHVDGLQSIASIGAVHCSSVKVRVTRQSGLTQIVLKFSLHFEPGRRVKNVGCSNAVEMGVEGRKRVFRIHQSFPQIDKSSAAEGGNANLADAGRI